MKERASHFLKEKPWDWKKLYFSDLLLPRLVVNATFDFSSMALRVFREFTLTFTVFFPLWFIFFILCENTFVFILYNSADLRLDLLCHEVYLFECFLWGNEDLVFLESPGNYSGQESCFVFVAFTFKIKVLIMLKIREWNYQLTEQNLLVYRSGTVLPFNRFGFHCLRARKVFRPFGKPAPGAILSQSGISLRVSKCRSSYPACIALC